MLPAFGVRPIVKRAFKAAIRLGPITIVYFAILSKSARTGYLNQTVLEHNAALSEWRNAAEMPLLTCRSKADPFAFQSFHGKGLKEAKRIGPVASWKARECEVVYSHVDICGVRVV